MKEGKLLEIFGGWFVAAYVSTVPASVIKSNDAGDGAMKLARQPTLFYSTKLRIIDRFTDNADCTDKRVVKDRG